MKYINISYTFSVEDEEEFEMVKYYFSKRRPELFDCIPHKLDMQHDMEIDHFSSTVLTKKK